MIAHILIQGICEEVLPKPAVDQLSANRLPDPGVGGGVLPEKLGGGVRPASQNPCPIYDQNLRYSLPYLWPDF